MQTRDRFLGACLKGIHTFAICPSRGGLLTQCR
jgi:hypothetical protein